MKIPTRKILQIISWAALVLLVIPPALYLAGTISLDAVKSVMLICTVVWFVVTPLWMERGQIQTTDEAEQSVERKA